MEWRTYGLGFESLDEDSVEQGDDGSDGFESGGLSSGGMVRLEGVACAEREIRRCLPLWRVKMRVDGWILLVWEDGRGEPWGVDCRSMMDDITKSHISIEGCRVVEW